MTKRMYKYIWAALFAAALLLLLAPAALADEADTVTVEPSGAVTLQSSHMAGEKVSSLQLQLDVSGVGDAAFAFDPALSGRITYSSLGEDGILDIYIAGTEPLMSGDTTKLVLGALTGSAPESAKLVDGSLQYVYGTRMMAQNISRTDEESLSGEQAQIDLRNKLEDTNNTYGMQDVQKQYTPESLAALQEAVDRANSLLADGDASEEELRQALQALDEAVDGLVNIGRAALDSVLTQAQSAASGSYTQESLDALEKAIRQAEEARDSGDESAWDSAAANLQKALDDLVPQAAGSGQEGAKTRSGGDSTKEGGSDKKTAGGDKGSSAPSTGDETQLLPWILLLTICGAALVFIGCRCRMYR